MISLDYFIYVILILEDTLAVSVCCLILSDSPVPTAGNCSLLKSQLLHFAEGTGHWAQLAFAVLLPDPELSWGPGAAWHSLGVRQAQHDLPSLQHCCAEADNKDGVEEEEKKDHPVELVKGK